MIYELPKDEKKFISDLKSKKRNFLYNSKTIVNIEYLEPTDTYIERENVVGHFCLIGKKIKEFTFKEGDRVEASKTMVSIKKLK